MPETSGLGGIVQVEAAKESYIVELSVASGGRKQGGHVLNVFHPADKGLRGICAATSPENPSNTCFVEASLNLKSRIEDLTNFRRRFLPVLLGRGLRMSFPGVRPQMHWRFTLVPSQRSSLSFMRISTRQELSQPVLEQRGRLTGVAGSSFLRVESQLDLDAALLHLAPALPDLPRSLYFKR
ncbi:hypothetical protein EVG20_g10310 [Dentipellis fragilis]|uniref:Uncharacterized protein n=1 Tax=Dentipellis fragilis TaxID=205917 RepID=A0A4Y9XS80_9AGAM|nr:hypothetical protein EVG20_g10310 [Dentipellis fragilis]